MTSDYPEQPIKQLTWYLEQGRGSLFTANASPRYIMRIYGLQPFVEGAWLPQYPLTTTAGSLSRSVAAKGSRISPKAVAVLGSQSWRSSSLIPLSLHLVHNVLALGLPTERPKSVSSPETTSSKFQACSE